MANKAYIVANEEQEMTLLAKLEREGMAWSINEKPTDFVPSECYVGVFPYVIAVGTRINFSTLSEVKDEEIVFDGRKEEQMADKYVVSQKFMNALEQWKIDYVDNSNFLDINNIGNLPPVVSRWWIYADIMGKENNNRLIAIIRWVNGEDVFEVEKPKKWVVRYKEKDGDGEYWYIEILTISSELWVHDSVDRLDNATQFDTKEEAESWANSHQEVVSVEE